MRPVAFATKTLAEAKPTRTATRDSRCSHRESNPGCLVEGQVSLPLDDDCRDCAIDSRGEIAMQPAGFEPASSD
jgi:hypothetical protein